MTKAPDRVPAAMRVPLAALFGIGVTFALGEAAMWVLNPPPRTQIVRDPQSQKTGITGFAVRHGHPVWRYDGSAPRHHPDCAPDDQKVLLLGSSIFWGTSYQAHEVVSARLPEALGPGWCVFNYAQPAYTSGSKLAEARDQVPTLRPDVVVWELWANDPNPYTMLDGDAYNTTGMVVDADGYPVAVPGVPSSLHHWLFRESKLWQYLSIALAPSDPNAEQARWTRFVDETLPTVLELTRSVDAQLLLVAMPRLDLPFAESVQRQARTGHGYQRSQAWAAQHGVGWTDAAASFARSGLTPEMLRHDPCCHYNPEGHAALAEVIAEAMDTRDPALAD